MAKSLDSNEQLNDDLLILVETLDNLLSTSADVAQDEVGELRRKAQATLDEVRERAGLVTQQGQCHIRQSVRCADHYVHQKPWQSVGIAAAVGVITGLLLARR